MGREGFEPSKPVRAADLQSAGDHHPTSLPKVDGCQCLKDYHRILPVLGTVSKSQTKTIHHAVSTECFMPCSSVSRVTFRPFLHRIAYRYITHSSIAAFFAQWQANDSNKNPYTGRPICPVGNELFLVGLAGLEPATP